MSLSIRQNPMHLSLFSAFCGIRSRVHAGQKDVYLSSGGSARVPDVLPSAGCSHRTGAGAQDRFCLCDCAPDPTGPR
ncbi:MAG: hypothetical protein ACLUB2_00030 [Butyricicoccus pullicaecorum]